MNPKPAIDILLATYNGERFIAEQIQSILDQTYSDWRLIIRDDGSCDTSVDIIRAFQNIHPAKIKLIEDCDGNLGVAQNFGRLLDCSRADYVMFCDQDDVWLPDKVAVTLATMEQTTHEHGAHQPLLIHTDLKVVNEELQVMSDSLWKYQHYIPNLAGQMNRLLITNVITGCTVMINKTLKELAAPIPQEALMHDWWLGLVATSFGIIRAIEKQTVLYRQHEGNVAGAKWNTSYFLETLRSFKERGRAHKDFLFKTQMQAETFAQRYSDTLHADAAEMVLIYAHLRSHSWFMRRWLMVRCGFWSSGTIRNMGLLLLI